ncbi:MAG: hypothetical protein LBF89_00190, partial [Bacteroidales bacterium]|nr:hypothetical protein [Bacteroidales bacterium]
PAPSKSLFPTKKDFFPFILCAASLHCGSPRKEFTAKSLVYSFFEALWVNGLFHPCFISRFLPIPFHNRRSLTGGKEASCSSAAT